MKTIISTLLCLILFNNFVMSQISSNGIIAHFEFNGNAIDESENNNDGILHGGVSWSTDRFENENSAALFDGIDGYIEVPNSVSLSSPTNALSITCWLLIDPNHNIVSSIVDKAPINAYGQYNFTYEHINPGQFKLYLNGQNTNSFGTFVQNDIPINEWCFVACTWDGNQSKIYVNDNLINSQNLTGTIEPDNNPVSIGLQKAGNLNNHFKGKIDEVRIYNRALTTNEINILYGVSNTRIVSNWTFTEMGGSSLVDHSGNGNNGQINGAVWQLSSGLRGLSFNGSDNYVTVPHNSDFNFGDGEFTVEAKFKTSVVPTGSWTAIVSKHNTATWHDREFFVMIEGTTGYPIFGLSTENGDFERAIGSTNICDGLFHTIRGVRQTNQIKLFLDGDLIATAQATINPDNNNPINIGRSSYSNGYGYFDGIITDVSIWNYALEITPVEDERNNNVIKYDLFTNYPNPFNPSTTIKYSLPISSKVLLKVYDILGRELVTLVDKFQNIGTYEVQFNAENFSSGVYFYRIETDNFITSKKMLLLK